MELNKSSTVPFKVMDPSTGMDITNDIRLTTIESEGTLVPYFKGNGDSTFTVVNASTEEIVTKTKFNFDVTVAEKDFSMTAESTMTIAASNEPKLRVKSIVPHDGFLSGSVGTVYYLEYQVTWNGEYLGVGEGGVVTTFTNGNQGYTEPVPGMSVVSDEMKEDGITHRVGFKCDSPVVSSILMVARRQEGKVEGTDFTPITYRAYILGAGDQTLRLISLEYNSNNVTGAKGEKQYLYLKLMLGAGNVDLNNADWAFTKWNSGADNSLRVSSKGKETLTVEIMGNPGIFTNYTLVATYGGKKAELYSSLRINEGLPANVTPQIPVMAANTDGNRGYLLKDISAVGTNWFKSPGSIITSGALEVRDTKLNSLISTVPLAGKTLDAVSRLIQQTKLEWMAQSVIFTAGEMDAPSKGSHQQSGTFYKPVVINISSATIPEAPVESYASVDTINKDGTTMLTVGIKQLRDAEEIFVPGPISNLVVTGAGANPLVVQPAKANEPYLISIEGNGSVGEVKLTFNITSPAPYSTVYTYEYLLHSKAMVAVTATPLTVPVKVYDVLDTAPFTVSVEGVETSSIRNLKLIPNNNIIDDVDNPGKWTVDTAKTAGEEVKTYFSFEVEAGGEWVSEIGYGIYKIAAWNGLKFTSVVVDNIVGASTERDTELHLRSIYKGKPAGDKVNITTFGSVNGYLKVVSYKVDPLNPDITIVTIRAKSAKAQPNSPSPVETSAGMKIVIKDSQGTAENIDVVTNNTTYFFINGDYLSVYGDLSRVGGPFGSVAAMGTWDSRILPIYIFANGVRVPLESSDLDYFTSSSGMSPSKPSVTYSALDFVGGTGTTLWFKITRPLITNGGYYNPPRFRLKSNPGKYLWAPMDTAGNSWVYPTTGYDVGSPVAGVPNGTPSQRNQLKFKVTRSGTLATGPNASPLPYIIKSPAAGNSLILEEPYTLTADPNDKTTLVLDFAAGHTGDSFVFRTQITDPTFTQYRLALISTVTVPKSPVIPTLSNNTFNGVSGSITELKFTLKQKRFDDPENNMSASTAISVASVTGSVGPTPTVVKNADNSYTLKVTGKGDVGPGVVNLNIVEASVTYPVTINLVGEIDSSKFKLEFTPKTISGKKGDKVKLDASLTNNGSAIAIDGQGIEFAFDPAGIIQINSRDKSAVTFEILKEVPETEEVTVKTFVKYQGMATFDNIDVTLTGAMSIIPTVVTAKVWDKSTVLPFIVKMNDVDVTSKLAGVGFTETANVKHNGDNGGWIITADTALETTTQTVDYWFRLIGDSDTVKRPVPITFNIAEYDGKEFVINVTAPSTIRTNGLAGVTIKGTYRGEPTATELSITEDVLQETAKRTNTKPITGGISFDLQATDAVVYNGKQQYVVSRGTGNVEGIDVATALFEITSWAESDPLAIKSVTPSSVEGEFGDSFPLEVNLYYRGAPLPITSAGVSEPTFTPNDSIKTTGGSISDHGLTIEFVKDIVENNLTKDVVISFSYSGVTGASNISVTQHSTELKLSIGEGFQTSGEGDIVTPVTLTQSTILPK